MRDKRESYRKEGMRHVKINQARAHRWILREAQTKIHCKEEIGSYKGNAQPPCLGNSAHYFLDTVTWFLLRMKQRGRYGCDILLHAYNQRWPAVLHPLFSFSTQCFPPRNIESSKRGEKQVGNVLTSLPSSSLVGVICAILCKMYIYFSIKIDQHD